MMRSTSHTNNIPDIGIHGCACYCHNLAEKKQKTIRQAKQNKTNEIKLDVTAATAAVVAATATVAALSIDEKPMAFFV